MKAINQALEVVRNSKATPFQTKEAWERLWKARFKEESCKKAEIGENIVSDDGIKAAPSAPGEDGNR